MYLLLKNHKFSSQPSTMAFFFFNRKGGDFFLGFRTPMKKLVFFRWGIARSRSWAKMATIRLTGALGMLALVEVGDPPWDPPLHRFSGEVPRNFFGEFFFPRLKPQKRKAGLFFRTQNHSFFQFFFLILSFGGVVEEVEMSWGDFSGVITWLVSSGEWSVFEKLFNSLMISRVFMVGRMLFRLFRASPDWWNFPYPLFLAENWPLHAVSNASTVDVGSNHGERRCLGICPS